MIMKLVLPLFMILIAFNEFANAQFSHPQLNLKIANVPTDTDNRYFTFNRNDANVFFHTNDWHNTVFGITTGKDEHCTVRVWKDCDNGVRACGRVEPYDLSTPYDWSKPMNVTHQSQSLIENLLTEINEQKIEINKQKIEIINNDVFLEELNDENEELQNQKQKLEDDLKNSNDIVEQLVKEYNDKIENSAYYVSELTNEKEKLQYTIKDLEEKLQDVESENRELLELKNSYATALEKDEDLMRKFGNLVDKNKSEEPGFRSDRLAELKRIQSYRL